MKSLALSLLILTPSIHGISTQKQQENELALQKEKDDLKVKVALITGAVTIIIIYLRGRGEDATAFDKMMLALLL